MHYFSQKACKAGVFSLFFGVFALFAGPVFANHSFWGPNADEPYSSDGEASLRSKIDALGNTPVAEFRIPVLLGVEVKDIEDTWGDARANGRTHEGTDILSPRGAYVVSPLPDVVARIGSGTNGGNYVYTHNPGGERFYFAHLDRVADGLTAGQVLKQGDLIGYVGNTGNASGGPDHLHLGIYNRGASNPFPRLKLAFTNDERVSAMTRILAASKDIATESKTLFEAHSALFTEAAARGVVMHASIQKLMDERKLAADTCALSKTIVIGTRGDSVRVLQELLIKENKGPAARTLAVAGATGYFGVVTKAALAEYLAALNTCGLSAPKPVIPVRDLTLGARGDDVKALQTILISGSKGPAAKTLAGAGATGFFGPITLAALVEYQKAVGIFPASGYFGPITRAYISRLAQ